MSSGKSRPICPTRVLCRGHALKTVIHNLEQILHGCTEPAVKARALMTTIGSRKFIIGVKIADAIIEYMENLNKAVQCRQSSVSGVIKAMKPTSESIQHLRTDSKFQ